MRRLILLRHAKTEKNAESGLDWDRCLDARGQEDAPEIGRYMERHGLRPDLVLYSPARRTRQTWELIAAELGPSMRGEAVQALYGADSGQLLRITRGSDGARPEVLMIIGHNPGLHDYSMILMKAGGGGGDRTALTYGIPTCGLVVFDFDTDSWATIGFRSATLERFVTPRLLREAAS